MRTPSKKERLRTRAINELRREAQAAGIASPYKQSLYISRRVVKRIKELESRGSEV